MSKEVNMTTSGIGVWRWNVDPVWHHFSWMCQEAELAETAVGTFNRYRHVSASLYFGIGAIEAFLNKKMRERFWQVKTEAEIHEMLRRTPLMVKVEQWPSVLCGRQITVPLQIIDAFDDFRKLRGEVTHQKRPDHSLFADLDATEPRELIQAVSHYQVVILEQTKEAFPYWLLGWNYIGFNHAPETPCLINNQQFRYSLRALGESVPAVDCYAADKWERDNMTSLDGFQRLKSILDAKTVDIEPVSPLGANSPRLTRNWWDPSARRS